jgi:hypothetical protein
MWSLLARNTALPVSRITFDAETIVVRGTPRANFRRQFATSAVSSSSTLASRQAVISACVSSAAVRRSG